MKKTTTKSTTVKAKIVKSNRKQAAKAKEVVMTKRQKEKAKAAKAEAMKAATGNLPKETKAVLKGKTPKAKIVRATVVKTNEALGKVKAAKSKKARKLALVDVAKLKAKLHKMIDFKQADWRAVRNLAATAKA